MHGYAPCSLNDIAVTLDLSTLRLSGTGGHCASFLSSPVPAGSIVNPKLPDGLVALHEEGPLGYTTEPSIMSPPMWSGNPYLSSAAPTRVKGVSWCE
jgi:hypothetical protein